MCSFTVFVHADKAHSLNGYGCVVVLQFDMIATV